MLAPHSEKVYFLGIGFFGINSLFHFLSHSPSTSSMTGLCLTALSKKSPQPLTRPFFNKKVGVVIFYGGLTYLTYLNVCVFTKNPSDFISSFGPLAMIYLCSLPFSSFRSGCAQGVRFMAITTLAGPLFPRRFSQQNPAYSNYIKTLPPIQLAFTGPIVEELTYRGFELPLIHTMIKKIYSNIVKRELTSKELAFLEKIAVTLSASSFALDHTGYPLQVAYTFMFAVWAGHVYAKDPLNAVGAHMTFNIVYALQYRA